MATTGRRPAYNRKMYSGQTYVYGNTVRKPDMLPRRQETFVPDRPKKVSRQVRQNRREAMHMNAAYVVFLAIAAVIALFVCVNYLQLRSELRSHSNNITVLQRELAEKKEADTTKLNNAMDSVNLKDVREKAMGELGMKYASADQVVTYKSASGNYVKQYKDIPKSGISAESDAAK